MVKVKIDGKEVEAPEGTNLIDAAERVGIHIPNLCYLKGSKGIGACRLCQVEIEGMKAPMLACTTKVKEGMVIRTSTKQIEEVRKFVIDLILSMHPLDCRTCTKAGVCQLQQYAYNFEIKDSSFTMKKFGYPTDESNPFIKRDPNYCILCGCCVRVCKEQDTNVLEFWGRGVGSKVVTAGNKPLQESGCTFCGSCVDVCPVNALLEANRWRRGREWEYEKIDSVCLLCGNTCDITISTQAGRIMKINAGGMKGSPERYICAYGRFGFDCIEADSRVLHPMKRINGELKEITWEEAVETVAKKLQKAGEKAGFISTASLLNEDALTLKRFASEAVKTKNVDTTASLYGDAATLISGGAELGQADLFVLVDLYPSQWTRILPAIDAIIRRRIKAGAKLITINSSESKIAEVATVSLVEKEEEALKSLAKALMDKGLTGSKKLSQAVSKAVVTEAINKAATLYVEAKNPVILTSPAMYKASANITLLKGTAVSVPIESNAKGVIMMGLVSEEKSYHEMVSGGVNLLYAIGEVPLHERPHVDFLVTQHSHLTELAKQADLVLPSAAYLEAKGTIVDYLGRLRPVNSCVGPAGESKPHREIFKTIAKALGTDIKEAKESEAKSLAKLKTKVSLMPFERKEGLEVNVEEMVEFLNASVINGSRLLWLKQIKEVLV